MEHTSPKNTRQGKNLWRVLLTPGDELMSGSHSSVSLSCKEDPADRPCRPSPLGFWPHGTPELCHGRGQNIMR